MVSRSAPSATRLSTDEKPEIVYRSLNYLLDHVNPANPKDHDLGEIIQSIVRHGFVGFVTFDPGVEMMVAGHGRLFALGAMRADGYDPPKRIIAPSENEDDWQVPTYEKVFQNQHERDAYTVGDNQTTILGGWNDEGLIAILSGLHDADPTNGLVGTGFDASDLQALIDARDFKEEPAPSPVELQTRFGISITVSDKQQENRVSDLLVAHGFQSFQRFSEG